MDIAKTAGLETNAAPPAASGVWGEQQARELALQMVNGSKRVLVLGRIDNSVAEALRDSGSQVVAVLGDRSAISALRPRVSAVIQGDVERIHLGQFLRGRTFDTVLVGRLLQRVADPVAVLKKVTPHIARGGSIVASIPNVAHASVRLALLRGAFEVGDSQQSLRLYTKETIERTFAEAGFSVRDMARAQLDPYAHPYSPACTWDVDSVPVTLRRLIEQDPEASVAQYVVRAQPRVETRGRGRGRNGGGRDAEDIASSLGAAAGPTVLFSAEERERLEAPAREAERQAREVAAAAERQAREVREAVERERADSEERLNTLERERDEARELAEKNETELRDLRVEIARTRSALSAAEAAIEQERADVEARVEAETRYEREALEQTREAVEKQVGTMRDELAAMREELEARGKRARLERERLIDSERRARDATEAAEIERAQLKRRIDEAVAQARAEVEAAQQAQRQVEQQLVAVQQAQAEAARRALSESRRVFEQEAERQAVAVNKALTERDALHALALADQLEALEQKHQTALAELTSAYEDATAELVLEACDVAEGAVEEQRRRDAEELAGKLASQREADAHEAARAAAQQAREALAQQLALHHETEAAQAEAAAHALAEQAEGYQRELAQREAAHFAVRCELESALAQSEQRVATLQQRVDNLDEALEALGEARDAARLEAANAEASAGRMVAALAARDREVREAGVRCETLEQRVRELEAGEEIRRELEEQHAAQQRELSERFTERERVMLASFAECEHEMAAGFAEREHELEAKLTSAQQALEAARAEHRASLAEYEASLAEQQEMLDKARAEHDAAVAALSREHSERIERTKRFSERRVAEAAASADERIGAWRDELGGLRKAVEQSKARESELQAREAELQTREAELQEQLGADVHTRRELEEALEDATASRRGLERALDDTKIRAREDMRRRDDTIALHASVLVQTAKELRVVKADATRLRHERRRAVEQVSAVRRAIDALVSDRESSTSEREALAEALQAAHKRVAEQMRALEQTRRQVEVRDIDLADVDRELERREGVIAHQVRQLEALGAEHDEVASRAAMLDSRVIELCAELADRDESVVARQREHGALLSRIGDLEEALKRAQSTRVQLERDSTQLTGQQRQQLEQTAKRVRALEQELERRGEAARRAASAGAEREQVLEHANTSMQQRASKLAGEANALRSALEQSAQLLAERECELRALQDELDVSSEVMSERVKALESAMHGLREQLERASGALQERELEVGELGGAMQAAAAQAAEMQLDLERHADALERELSRIRQSLAWRVLERCERATKALLPSGTRRRELVEWLIGRALGPSGQLRSAVNSDNTEEAIVLHDDWRVSSAGSSS